MSTTVNVTSTKLLLVCDACGIEFAVPNDWHRRRLQDHAWWYCPNGHQWQYTGKSDSERLQEAIVERNNARLERDCWRADAVGKEARLETEKKKAKRLRKRIAAGVCPCCTRSFTNLQRHMESKHPDYATNKLPAGGPPLP